MEASIEEQTTLGRTARTEVPRSTPSLWRPAADRPDPVAVLRAQDADRAIGLVPLRHARMAQSPFTFYRGGAAIMARDLATLPVSGIHVQLCGDAHLSNLGTYGAPDRALVFDLNDFDETLRGPWEWDVLRMATSFTIAARDRDLTADQGEKLTRRVVAAYRSAVTTFAAESPLATWYARLDTDQLRTALASRSKQAARSMDKGTAKARRRTSLQAVAKLTDRVDGQSRFRSDPPVLVPLVEAADGREAELAHAIRANYADYLSTLPDGHRFLLERYRMVDIAHKVVGVGSVGTRAFVVLFESAAGDPLILQIKEANRSVLEDHLGDSPYPLHGQRVVEGQRMMQAASDIFLGWSRSANDGRQYYWRQLRDMKGSAVIEEMTPQALEIYADLCGWSLARAHARSGSAAAIAAYLGSSDRFDRSCGDFGARYADLNDADARRHSEAIASGEVPCADDPATA